MVTNEGLGTGQVNINAEVSAEKRYSVSRTEQRESFDRSDSHLARITKSP